MCNRKIRVLNLELIILLRHRRNDYKGLFKEVEGKQGGSISAGVIERKSSYNKEKRSRLSKAAEKLSPTVCTIKPTKPNWSIQRAVGQKMNEWTNNHRDWWKMYSLSKPEYV